MRTLVITTFLAVFAMASLAGAPVRAQEEPTAEPKPGENEPVGTWRFRTERPVKAVVIGGSVSAYTAGNFADFLGQACQRVEIVNRGKARYGAWALRQRFKAQVLSNPNVRLRDAGQEHWLIFQGGLNSVGMPEQTNEHVRELFTMAHAAGMKVLALSLSPWGEEADKRRWKGLNGLTYWQATQKAVDFVMGRLAPSAALGRHAEGRASDSWQAGELPALAVDLYDSPLRDREAPLRDQAALARELDRSSKWRKHLESLPEPQREPERQRLLQRAAELPRWFLRKELRGFDHIHPNREGHRVIARTACPKLPASWGCDCSLLE